MNSPSAKRVVVTGMGVISPLGSSVKQYWEGLISGRSGIRRITQFDPGNLPCQIAGEVPDFEPKNYMEKKEARRYPRSAQLALASASIAYSDAKLDKTSVDPERIGVVFGTGMGGFDLAYQGIDTLRTRGVSKINPFTIPGCIPNLSAYVISKTFSCLGLNLTITTACATGTQTIGVATDYIRRGKADAIIAGGTESLIKDFYIYII